jgi:formate dehydrogenase subunit delta
VPIASTYERCNMSPDKLAHMANQIGRFFATQKPESAVASITDHLLRFWDPRMRRAIIAQLDEGRGDLDPLVREAVKRLEDRT